MRTKKPNSLLCDISTCCKKKNKRSLSKVQGHIDILSHFQVCSKILLHSVWKSQNKSHSTLRAKRATFTFWVDKSSLKMQKNDQFGEFLRTWSLRSNSVTRQVTFNRPKMVENAKINKLKCDIFSDFQNNVSDKISVKVSLFYCGWRFFSTYKEAPGSKGLNLTKCYWTLRFCWW